MKLKQKSRIAKNSISGNPAIFLSKDPLAFRHLLAKGLAFPEICWSNLDKTPTGLH